ncbi:hypothetical protein [uncultured Vagococcus sp.]|uniref:hypothetical protein n=1 Tax=uncultured Vagococcus sp. TaxID=189676 RepID=UPI0028D4202D|nr:hypothetical protein [uncultured Vagococcus sp.]
MDIPELPTGATYDWYELYVNSDFDSYDTLYNSEGDMITKNDDSNGNRDFKISRDLSPGTYYLEVRALSSSTTGSYVMRADNRKYTITSSQRILSNSTLSGTLNSSEPDYKLYDFYIFDKKESTIYADQSIVFHSQIGGTVELLNDQHQVIEKLTSLGHSLGVRLICIVSCSQQTVYSLGELPLI